MRKGPKRHEWLIQLGVFAAYTLAYLLLHPLSHVHLALISGLRLGCLLLVPYRYWAVMALAEILPLAYYNYQCIDQFGPIWVIFRTIPPMLYGMPVVAWMRSRQLVFPSKRTVDIGALLVCIGLVSLLWGLGDFANLATVLLFPASPPLTLNSLQLIGYFLGAYVGCLTLLPLIAMAALDLRGSSVVNQLRELVQSPVLVDTAIVVIPSIILLGLVEHLANAGITERAELTLIVRMAMFLPVAWQVAKHGWRPAAFGSSLVIVVISMSLSAKPDPGILETQAFMAFAVTCLLALGARITARHREDGRKLIDASEALRLAQRGLYRSELRLRQTSYALEQISGAIALTQSGLVSRLRHLMSPHDGRSLAMKVADSQRRIYEIANSIYPLSWRDRGLPAALQEGLGRALDEMGISYQYKLEGRGLSELSAGTHLAIYRLACEAVTYAGMRETCTAISVQVRGGKFKGNRWAVLRISGLLDGPSDAQKFIEREQLGARLGADRLDLSEMRDQARIYRGDLHVRAEIRSIRITALLRDVATTSELPGGGGRVEPFLITPRLLVN